MYKMKYLSGEYQKGKGLFLKILGGFFLATISILLIILISLSRAPFNVIKTASVNEGTTIRRWYRGNTHTHTKIFDFFNTDNISAIASWYEAAGYDFLMITDHNNHNRDKRIICHDEAADPPGFIMLCGLELSRTRHLTALGIDRFIGDEESLQDGVNKTIAAGGVAILNHPQYPVITAAEFISTNGLNHLEVFNGKRPKDTHATEMLWDSILSAPDGRLVYAVASDDNHHRKRKAGRGWIMVDALSLTKDDIKENILRGNFYSSTGIIIKNYEADQKKIVIGTENGTRIIFIGFMGKILSMVNDSKAIYNMTGNEQYIRVKITGEDGKTAWTQPIFLK